MNDAPKRQAPARDVRFDRPTSEATPLGGFPDPTTLQTARLLAAQAGAETCDLNRADPSERAASALQALSDELRDAGGAAHGLAFQEIRAFLDIAVRTLRSNEAGDA